MLKLSTLLKHKGTVVIGDSYYHLESKDMLRCVSSGTHAVCYNRPHELDESVILHSFVPRNNEGVMPVDKDLPVVITLRSGEVQHRRYAGKASWRLDIGNQSIDTWVPDIDALLKLQELEEPKFKHKQIVYVKGYGDRKWNFGCYTLDGKNALLLDEGSHISVSVDAISIDPPVKYLISHWYPCVSKESGRGSVKRFNGHYFFDETFDSNLETKPYYSASDFSFIGSSLGTDLFAE